MGCSCKVKRHLTKIEKQYGTKILPSKKTEISNQIKLTLKKIGVWILLLPLTPLMIIWILTRKIFTNKPIFIGNLIKN